MTKTGKKFRTVHKFGKKRKKTKKKTGDVESIQHQNPLPSPSTSTVIDDSASRSPQPSASSQDDDPKLDQNSLVASHRKIEYFKRKRRESDSSEEESASVTQKKKRKEVAAHEGVEVKRHTMNVLMDLNCMQSLITQSGARCPRCNEPSLIVLEGGPGERRGSACLLELCCQTCGKLSSEYTSQKTGLVHTGFDNNHRLVAAFSSIGVSFSQCKRAFALLGLPQPMNESTWYDYKRRVHGGVSHAADIHLQEAAHQVCSTYADMNLGF